MIRDDLSHQWKLLALIAQSDGKCCCVCDDGRMHMIRLFESSLGSIPGTPGKRFAEYTTNGSVKVWARTGETSV